MTIGRQMLFYFRELLVFRKWQTGIDKRCKFSGLLFEFFFNIDKNLVFLFFVMTG